MSPANTALHPRSRKRLHRLPPHQYVRQDPGFFLNGPAPLRAIECVVPKGIPSNGTRLGSLDRRLALHNGVARLRGGFYLGDHGFEGEDDSKGRAFSRFGLDVDEGAVFLQDLP